MIRSVLRLSRKRMSPLQSLGVLAQHDEMDSNNPYIYIILSSFPNADDESSPRIAPEHIMKACERTKKKPEWNNTRGEETWIVLYSSTNSAVARVIYLYNLMISMPNMYCYNDIFQERISKDKFVKMLQLLYPLQLSQGFSSSLDRTFEFKSENIILESSLEARVLDIWALQSKNIRPSTRFLGDKHIINLNCSSCVIDHITKTLSIQCEACKEEDNFHHLYQQQVAMAGNHRHTDSLCCNEKKVDNYDSIYLRLLPKNPGNYLYLVPPIISLPYPEDVDPLDKEARSLSETMYKAYRIILEESEKNGPSVVNGIRTKSFSRKDTVAHKMLRLKESAYWADYDLLQKSIDKL